MVPSTCVLQMQMQLLCEEEEEEEEEKKTCERQQRQKQKTPKHANQRSEERIGDDSIDVGDRMERSFSDAITMSAEAEAHQRKATMMIRQLVALAKDADEGDVSLDDGNEPPQARRRMRMRMRMLIEACRAGSLFAVELLLYGDENMAGVLSESRPCSADQREDFVTALHSSIANQRDSVCEALLRSGCVDVNATVSTGRTRNLSALHLAVHRGTPRCVGMLLAFGAEVGAVTSALRGDDDDHDDHDDHDDGNCTRSKTVMAFARERGDSSIIALIDTMFVPRLEAAHHGSPAEHEIVSAPDSSAVIDCQSVDYRPEPRGVTAHQVAAVFLACIGYWLLFNAIAIVSLVAYDDSPQSPT